VIFITCAHFCINENSYFTSFFLNCESPETVYWNEVRTNNVQYQQDLDKTTTAKSSAEANLCAVLENSTKELNAYIASTNSTSARLSSEAESRKAIAYSKYQAALHAYNQHQQIVNNLQQKNEQARKKLSELQQQKLHNQQEIEKHQANKSEAQANIEASIAGASSQARSALFIEFFKNEQMKPLILKYGIDIDYVAYKAIESDNVDLLTYAIDQGVDFDKTSFEGRTLIEYAIIHSALFLSQILEATQDISCSILQLINKDDSTSLEILLDNINENVNELRLSGTTILQTAIAANAKEVSLFLINKYPDLIKERSHNHDTAFEFVLRHGDSELIEKMLKSNEINAAQMIIELSTRKYTADNIPLIIKTAELDQEIITPALILSVLEEGSIEAVEALLRVKNIDILDCLLLAGEEGNTDLIDKLYLIDSQDELADREDFNNYMNLDELETSIALLGEEHAELPDIIN
jgi:ankyrin repeat protein